MKKISIILTALCLLLAACRNGDPSGGAGGPGDVVYVFNWGEYMDESLNKVFEEETGIRVRYTTYQNNEMLYSTIKGGGSSYDVIIPSDYMIGRLIEEDLLLPLDFDNIPNFDNIDPRWKDPSYDPHNLYSVPYMWGTVGIVYDAARVSAPIDSWGALFDEQYKGQILMFDNARDAFGIALLYLGYSLNATDEAELREAYDLLAAQKPLVQAYVMDQIFDKMEGGEAIIAPYYAGDAITMMEGNEDLAFIVPEEGANYFVDAFCIPKGAANKTAAELYINFMCSYDAGVANMEETAYSTPLLDVYVELDDGIKDDGISYPYDLSAFEMFHNLPRETRDLYDTLWTDLRR